MNSRQMQQMMKQMGIQQQDLAATKVEIYLEDRKLVIEPAQVAAVNAMGQKTYQVTGSAREEALEIDSSVEISDEDVQTVAEQTGKSEDEARLAIEEADGDLAQAIMKLQEEN